jgi:hypothetical protein
MLFERKKGDRGRREGRTYLDLKLIGDRDRCLVAVAGDVDDGNDLVGHHLEEGGRS